MKRILTIKTFNIVVSLILAAVMLFSVTACGENKDGGDQGHVDYAASVKLDAANGTLQQEVTVHAFIDGDTTHFKAKGSSNLPAEILKARYLGINTPESTGKIEEWGKAASKFTKEKLSNATSIIVESDNSKWNADSTGDRYLVWVWYKGAEDTEYRNLNIEILQQGLAIASNSANNRYGETCMNAINQARVEKLHVNSGEKDPDFPYGAAQELTLKELRTNIKTYDNQKVAFEGVIVKNNNNTVYVEEYDAESGMYFGIQVYYGYALNGTGLQILSVGNRVRIVGTVTYYETGGTYQVSGLEYSPMRPTDPNNIQKISEGNKPAYQLVTPKTLNSGKVTIAVGEENKKFKYAEAAIHSSVSMKGLKVVDTYTTTNEESSSKGAITLTCTKDGETVDVRTIVLTDKSGNVVKSSLFAGKTIDVKGVIDYFSGRYQIKVYSLDDITIH